MRITKDHMPWDYGKRLRGGHLWICPECGIVNAWNWDDAVRASEKLKVDVQLKVAVCHGSCFDNICGGCQARIVHPDSPILASCYTHSED